MRYIILLVLILSSLQAEDKQKITLGLGSYLQTQPYSGVDTVLLPSPVLFFDNDLFYIRWTRFGMYFLGNKTDDLSWGFSLTVHPRIYGYDANKIAGMNKRETSFEGGIAFGAKKDNAHIEIMALTDILDRHDTWILSTEIGYDFKIKEISIYPSIIATYQSSDFTNYYYGVTQSEATARGEAEYIPKAGLQLTVQTYIEYPLTNKLSALINLRADKLSSQATASTIVSDDYIYSGLASLIYTFHY